MFNDFETLLLSLMVWSAASRKYSVEACCLKELG